MIFSLRAEEGSFTAVRGRHALGEHAVRDDTKHAKRKHHGDDGEAKLEHGLHRSLWRRRNSVAHLLTDTHLSPAS